MTNLFIPQKVLSLGKALEKKNPKLEGSYLITPKIDGWYIYFPYTAKTKTWHTPRKSSMNICKSFEWLFFEKYLENLPKPTEDCILIAEAYIKDMPFPEMNGIFNKTIGNYNCKDVTFAVHDIVVLNSLRAYPLFAKERFDILMSLDFSKVLRHFEKVHLLADMRYSEDGWRQTFNRTINLGYEGFVAKRSDSLFSFGKRNSDLLKVKLECTIDCVAVSLEETVGEKGNDGLVLVVERINGVQIRCVISKHSDKLLFRSNPQYVIGKVVEIKGMEEYEDGQLRHPVFSHIREDKNITEID